MALDPEFIKKVQERKARREALERRTGSSSPTASRGKKSGPVNKGPVFRSVSMLSGKETIISGEDAKKKVRDGVYNG